MEKKLTPKKREGDISNVERVENIQNEISYFARRLLSLISEELDASGFTFEEIVANFNFLTENNKKSSGKTIDIDYGREHIEFLLETGMIEETDMGVFEITPLGFQTIETRYPVME